MSNVFLGASEEALRNITLQLGTNGLIALGLSKQQAEWVMDFLKALK